VGILKSPKHITFPGDLTIFNQIAVITDMNSTIYETAHYATAVEI